MAVSKSQQKAVHKYVKANYDRMEMTVPKGRKELIKAHANSQGQSVNSFINRAIQETIERDTGTAGKPAQTVGISVPPDVLEAVQRAAEAAGEAVPEFIARAVSETAERDKQSRDI